MFRNRALQDLSRDHHATLIQARRLRQAAAGSVAERSAAVSRLREAWDDLLSHCEDEERHLMNLITDPDAAERLIDDHAILRELGAGLFEEAAAGRLDPDRIRVFAQHIEANVRWEEEELLPLIERCAEPGALARLDRASGGAHPA